MMEPVDCLQSPDSLSRFFGFGHCRHYFSIFLLVPGLMDSGPNLGGGLGGKIKQLLLLNCILLFLVKCMVS